MKLKMDYLRFEASAFNAEEAWTYEQLSTTQSLYNATSLQLADLEYSFAEILALKQP
jgi:hypothetical protein